VVVVELSGSVVVVVVVVELKLVVVAVVVGWQGRVVVVVDPVVDDPVVDEARVVVDRLVVLVAWRLALDARVVALAAAARVVPEVPEVPGAAAVPVGAPAATVTPPPYRRAQPRIAST
jgi:hypothetical protein